MPRRLMLWTVIGATSQGDPLTDEFTVRANQFKRKAEENAHPDDDFKKNGHL